ncbi:S1C family serine protease [Pseudalkalibacillus caeni]|uniref:PDZ domain-containing protein n=1 Tax=Exobacillus caeni TaxID=2574798 RepID=A0A5R9F4J9_9BACL|nr:trypsin-like peptidase domain-containing protein [Pseudalkalibacillus caeni]TLS35414.1 PDZ domain-containing protein [Pseudalkalibacillus caeni]
MGFYDDNFSSRQRKQKGNRGGMILAGLFGAILGAMIILFSIPALSELGVLPEDFAVKTPDQGVENGNNGNGAESGTVRNVSIDVTTDVTEAVDKINDAVVGVINLQKSDFWSEDYGEAGAGSGVIYKKADGKAFVVTNNHVVEGAGQIEVSLDEETKVPAKLVGTDPLMDLAVLQIDSKKVKAVAEFGNSDQLKPGEPAIAIGNPLGFLEGTVTQGIISNPNRTIPADIDQDGVVDWNAEVIQTDASINPGNSGGALVNLSGQLVGINSMKIAQQHVEGIGFAIPINIAEPIINDLERYGKVQRPFIGIGMRSLSEIPTYHWKESLKLPDKVDYGVVVMNVVPMSPAEQAGLKELDVIVDINGNKVKNAVDLRKVLYTKTDIGDKITITYYSGGKKQTTEVTLAKQQSS